MSATTSVSTSAGPLPAGGAIGRLLRAPFTRRSWAELVYALISLPLALAGFVYLAFSIYVSGLLLISLVGLPLLAAAVLGARQLAALHRLVASGLLGLRVEAPPPFRPRPGLIGWIRPALSDGPGWRAMGYLLLKPSSRSGTEGNCVEVRAIDGIVEVRDSKNAEGAVLRFTPAEWVAFIGGAEGGEFRLP